MSESSYDLVVIGSGPAGQKGAIAAAKLGKNVALIDRKEMVGGVCLHTGTIPSKTLREAILYLSGIQQRSFYGRDYSVKSSIAISDLAFRVQHVMAREMEVVRAQLKRNGVVTCAGTARFTDPHTIEVASVEGTSHPARRARPHRLRHAAGTQRRSPDGRQADPRFGPDPSGRGTAQRAHRRRRAASSASSTPRCFRR